VYETEIEGKMAQAENRGAQASVAVVVPSYNHAPFVEQCLRSVYAQTSPPGRLLVIDDGSTDGSPRLISNVLEECPFPCELIARPNRGLSATLNEGLSRTTGELFAYIGSDDVWHPERLEAGVRALRENPRAVLAYSDCYVIDEDQRIVGSTKDWSSYASGSVFTDLMQVRFVPLSPTVLYRREAIARFGWREDGPLEDYETYLKLAYVGEFAYVLKFAFAGDILAAGQRWRAAKLSVMHAAGAPSIGVLARRGARLLAPRTLLEKREALLARRSALKRGSL
jgi:glycosyltransferase involved in cell wall biosynthesis